MTNNDDDDDDDNDSAIIMFVLYNLMNHMILDCEKNVMIQTVYIPGL